MGKHSSVKGRRNGLLRLTLVRHGQTPWNREQRVQGISDISLSNRGLAQANNLALALKNERIATILSSPLRRALQTAEAINRFHGLAIERDQNLMELDQGDFEGQTFPEIMKTHKAFLQRWAADPASVIMPNGESLEQLQRRAWTAVERILATETHHAVLVSHNFTIMTILCKIQDLSLRHVRKVHVDVASRTTVQFKEGRGEIILFNDVSHLKGSEQVKD